jgi:hypothetical protein
MFSLTLDNASSNLVAVNDIIDDLRENGTALVCDGIFFHIRCACHVLNLVARDGMAVISKALQKIKALVLTVKGFSLTMGGTHEACYRMWFRYIEGHTT